MKKFWNQYLFTKLNFILMVSSCLFGGIGIYYAPGWFEGWVSILIGLSTNIVVIIITVSLVQYYLDISRENDEQKQELEKIMRFNRIVHILRGSYVRYFNCLVTPIKQRSDLEPNVIRKGYQFSDLQDLYKPTLSLADSFSISTVERFFQAEEALRGSFLYMVENINFDYFPELKEIILPFIQISFLFDMRNAIRDNKNMKIGEEKYIEFVETCIKEDEKYHWMKLYKNKQLLGNLMLAYTALFEMLQEEERYLGEYDNFIKEHTAKN